MESDAPESCSSCCAGWRLSVLLVLVLASIVLVRILGDRLATTTAVEDAQLKAEGAVPRERVSLSIDFGDGKQRDFENLAWHEGMTVADLLQAAPGLTITQRGSGQGTFLTAIGDTTNEGADGKNWMYEVNDEHADRSFAVYVLRPGDRVLWKFGERR